MTDDDPFRALRILMEENAPAPGIALEVVRLVEAGIKQVDIANAVGRSESWVSRQLTRHAEGIAKPFVRLSLGMAEFETLRGAVDDCVRMTSQKVISSLLGAEKRFYTGELAKLEALQARLTKIAPRGEDDE